MSTLGTWNDTVNSVKRERYVPIQLKLVYTNQSFTEDKDQSDQYDLSKIVCPAADITILFGTKDEEKAKETISGIIRAALTKSVLKRGYKVSIPGAPEAIGVGAYFYDNESGEETDGKVKKEEGLWFLHLTDLRNLLPMLLDSSDAEGDYFVLRYAIRANDHTVETVCDKKGKLLGMMLDGDILPGCQVNNVHMPVLMGGIPLHKKITDYVIPVSFYGGKVIKDGRLNNPSGCRQMDAELQLYGYEEVEESDGLNYCVPVFKGNCVDWENGVMYRGLFFFIKNSTPDVMDMKLVPWRVIKGDIRGMIIREVKGYVYTDLQAAFTRDTLPVPNDESISAAGIGALLTPQYVHEDIDNFLGVNTAEKQLSAVIDMMPSLIGSEAVYHEDLNDLFAEDFDSDEEPEDPEDQETETHFFQLKLVYLNSFLFDPRESTSDYDVSHSIIEKQQISLKIECGDVDTAKEKIREYIRNLGRERKNAEPDDLAGLGVPEAVGFGAYFTNAFGEELLLEDAEWIQTLYGSKPYVSFRRLTDTRRVVQELFDNCGEDYYIASYIIKSGEHSVRVDYQTEFDFTSLFEYEYTTMQFDNYWLPGRSIIWMPVVSKTSSLIGRTTNLVIPTHGRLRNEAEPERGTGWDFHFPSHYDVAVRDKDGRECVVEMFLGRIENFTTGEIMKGLFYFFKDENPDILDVKIIPWRAVLFSKSKAAPDRASETLEYVYTDLLSACREDVIPEEIRVECTREELEIRLSRKHDLSIVRLITVDMLFDPIRISQKGALVCDMLSNLVETRIDVEEFHLDSISMIGNDSAAVTLGDNLEVLASISPEDGENQNSDFGKMVLSSRNIYRYSSEHYGIVEVDPDKKLVIIERENDVNAYDLALLERYGMETDTIRSQMQFMLDATNGMTLSEEYVETVRRSNYAAKINSICSSIENFTNGLTYEIGRKLRSETYIIKDPLWSDICFRLYGEEYVPDKNIVTEVYYAYLKYVREGKISQFAICGDPGCGKSTLAEGLADIFINGAGSYRKAAINTDPLHSVTPNDMKSPYVSDANHYIAQAMEKITKKGKLKALFIDEAYEFLHSRNNSSGGDAMVAILKIMDGETKAMFSEADKNRREIKVEWEEIPFIWFGGYENEIREMVSRNAGLYRRLTFLVIDTPTIEQLYDSFVRDLKRSLPSLFSVLNDSISREVKEYFRWGTGKDNVRFFGNYAGVHRLVDALGIRIEDTDTPLVIMDKLRGVIKRSKRDIRKQYRASISAKNKDNDVAQAGVSFETQKDIEDDFTRVRGNRQALESMNEIKDMLIYADDYHEMGISIPKGALMMGEPGTGKTLLARALAGEVQKEISANPNCELKVAFLAVGATDFRSPQDISALFSEADNYDICIIFIDEIDAIGKNRNAPGAIPSLLIQLMKEMDGFDVRGGLFVLAATNNPEVLDDALKRPGRFDRMIEVSLPNEEERADVIEFYLNKLNMPWSDDKDAVKKIAAELAHLTPGDSPAELRNMINEAAILNRKVTKFFADYQQAEKRGAVTPSMEEKLCSLCFHRVKKTAGGAFGALKKVSGETAQPLGERYLTENTPETFLADLRETREVLLVGHIRTNREEKFKIDKNDFGTTAVALHEVGHALVGYWNDIKLIDFITTIPRGGAAGYVRPSVDTKLHTKAQHLGRIKSILGGRAVEEVFYSADNISTGASSDISMATDAAKKLIGLFGMDDEIGMVNLYSGGARYLSGQEVFDCSDDSRALLDTRIRSLIGELYRQVVEEVSAHKEDVEYMAGIVFEKETMSGDEFFKEYEQYLAKKAEA